MSKMKAGFIGFMPFGTKGDDYYRLLEEYAALGYKGFEHGSGLFSEGNPEENLARVRTYGIEPVCMGYMAMPGRPKPDLGELAEKAHRIGVTRVVTYNSVAAFHRFGFKKEVPTYEEVMAEIEEFERVATFLKGEGLQFMFHNHDAELKLTYEGKCSLERMLENTENLSFELDTGWVTYAGYDPVKLIHRMGKRIGALHIKDYREGAVPNPQAPQYPQPKFTTPGTGKLDLYGVLEAGAAIGQEWAIIEQDFQNNLTQKETLTAAYLNMKETGFVE